MSIYLQPLQTGNQPLQTGINRYKRGKRTSKKHPLALQPQRVTRFTKNQIDYIDLIDYIEDRRTPLERRGRQSIINKKRRMKNTRNVRQHETGIKKEMSQTLILLYFHSIKNRIGVTVYE